MSRQIMQLSSGLPFFKGAVAVSVAALLAFAPGTIQANAAVLGPQADKCADDHGPAVLVEIAGLKKRSGSLRIQSYGGDPSRFFEKGAWLERIDVPVPAAGSVSVCVPVPKPGTYAISVRHDMNGNGKSDMSDGGGMSGNPEISLFDLMFKKKPPAREVVFTVGDHVRTITVTMNYVQGGAFRPIKQASR